MNKTTRESALGIKLKIVEIEEFGGFSQTNVKDLVEYLKEIRNLSEVSYLYIVHFVFKFFVEIDNEANIANIYKNI